MRYWITDGFGDRCYLGKNRTHKGILRVYVSDDFCELTRKGQRKFIKRNSRKENKKQKWGHKG